MSIDASSDTLAFPPFLDGGAFLDGPEDFGTHEPLDQGILEEKARALLIDRMGAADPPTATAYACGTVGVQADQTHYSDGFGLLLPLRQGVAVAARRSEASRIAFAGAEHTWSDESSDVPAWFVTVRRILQDVLAGHPVEVAVVSTVPGVCRDGYLAALAVAVIRVVRALDVSTAIDLNSVQSLRDDLVPLLAGEIGVALDQPYSTAYLLATFGGADAPFTLVDTSTREHLPVETEARNRLRWAVIDPGVTSGPPAAFHRRRQSQAREVLSILRQEGFESLESFRELEHRDLEDAVDILSEELGPVARHLVTENRRVQKHVAAMRRSDWQMVGALLLMSHASQRDQWKGTTDAADALVREVESLTHDGVYGACMTGRAGAVLVVGRPNNFERMLRSLVEAGVDRGLSPRILAP